MKIHIISRKPILDDRHGRLITGQIVDVVDNKALFYIQRGEAEALETKEKRERPLPPAGKMEQSSVLPAAQVSQPETLNTSENGEKKRGRKPKQSS